jgi:uncharacterized protein YkwD
MGRQRTRLAATLAALLCLAAVPASAPAKTFHTTRFERRVLTLLNHARAKHHLRPLRFRPGLVRAARRHSTDMLQSGSFDHGDFVTRITQYYPDWQRIGEDIAWGTGGAGSARALVSSWMHSAGHRANILDPGFRLIGVGAALGTFQGHRKTRLLTADFAC